MHGTCFEGRCFCDPGWSGDDCAVEAACDADCSSHGVCAYGVCFCDPGWEGPACDVVVPCPAQCSGHGTCALARCYCDDGWRGADCATPASRSDNGLIGIWNCLLLLLPVGLMGGLLGWWVRHLLEQRQRRKMREILQQEAQRPFSSDVGKAG